MDRNGVFWREVLLCWSEYAASEPASLNETTELGVNVCFHYLLLHNNAPQNLKASKSSTLLPSLLVLRIDWTQQGGLRVSGVAARRRLRWESDKALIG